jgi:hypothetical protein
MIHQIEIVHTVRVILDRPDHEDQRDHKVRKESEDLQDHRVRKAIPAHKVLQEPHRDRGFI